MQCTLVGATARMVHFAWHSSTFAAARPPLRPCVLVVRKDWVKDRSVLVPRVRRASVLAPGALQLERMTHGLVASGSKEQVRPGPARLLECQCPSPRGAEWLLVAATAVAVQELIALLQRSQEELESRTSTLEPSPQPSPCASCPAGEAFRMGIGSGWVGRSRGPYYTRRASNPDRASEALGRVVVCWCACLGWYHPGVLTPNERGSAVGRTNDMRLMAPCDRSRIGGPLDPPSSTQAVRPSGSCRWRCPRPAPPR